MNNSIAQNLTSNALFHQQGGNIHSIASELMRAKPDDAAVAAKEFEAVFVAQMLQHMFSQIPEDKIFGGGEAEQTWRSMLVDEYGKVMAKSGSIGVADQVQKELLRIQGL